MAEWANWSGRQTDTPQQILRPTAEAELVHAVAQAATEGLPLRAVGASHSHSRIAATNGVLVDMDGWQGLVAADADNKTARIKAGTRIFQLGEPLHQHGLTLHNQGDIDRQSVAGATATGTHGTGPALQNLSNSVVGARVILASGDTIDITADDGDLFEVARHSLGALGLITELTFAVRDAYRLHETIWKEAPDDVFDRIDQLVTADAIVDDLPDIKHERIGWSHNIISSTRDDLHTEMEYAVPADVGPACFNEVRETILRDFPDLQWPLEYRTLAADDLWISAAGGRETVTISAHQDISLDDRPLFEACEAIFRKYNGRPHWGKQHYQTAAELSALYPRYHDWWQIRDQHDPTNVFVSDYLASLRP